MVLLAAAWGASIPHLQWVPLDFLEAPGAKVLSMSRTCVWISASMISKYISMQFSEVRKMQRRVVATSGSSLVANRRTLYCAVHTIQKPSC